MRRALLVLVFTGVFGCNGLYGIDEPTVNEEGVVDGGSDESEDRDPSESDAAAVGVCGDGQRDVAEECDDGNDEDGDGCSRCEVDCGQAPAFRDPGSHHCYLLHAEGPLADWSEAETLCVAWGGHLASITSDEELAFVTPRLTLDTWIGASQAGPTASFEWINGDPWEYTSWGDDEPSMAGSCVALYAEGPDFSVRDCAAVSGYLCERDPTL